LKIEEIEWDDDNVEHISLHNVIPEEVEELFIDTPLYRKAREGKYFCFGQALDGRYLFCVIAFKGRCRVRPITAREMDKKELRFYRDWLRR